MRTETCLSHMQSVYGSASSKTRLCDLFVGLPNVISSDKIPKGLFKTQSNYLGTLELPEYLEAKVVGPAICRYICFNQNDTKSVLYFPDENLIYDPEPYWLKKLPSLCTSFSSCHKPPQLEGEYIFSRSSMSFAHFLSGELGSLLALDQLVKPGVPIYMPYAKKWHYDVIKFFGINRQVVTSLKKIDSGLVHDLKVSNLHLLSHLEEYQGLCISRFKAQTNLAKKCISPSKYGPYVSGPRILWLTRYNYEKSNGLPFRMINFLETQKLLSSRFDIEFCSPEEYDIESIASKIYHSTLLICESGSLFMNYLLFASRVTKIIQLTPQYCLGPTWSFYNINNMQWYFPVLGHLSFFEGENSPQINRQFGSSWNVPSSYNIEGLSVLIDSLLRRI